MGNFNVPIWNEQGPGPMIVPNFGLNKATGAIEALATDPVDPDRVFVATVGGGVWRSLNAISAKDPFWEPLTDFMPSLSMTAIAFDQNDTTRNTLYAGCGDRSHALPLVGGTASIPCGLLKTTDGGSTWTELARNTFGGYTISRIWAFGIVVYVTTQGAGMFRSIDGGLTWASVAAIAGNSLTDLAWDRTNSNIFYVAGSMGIFKSNDWGNLQWVSVNNNLGQMNSANIRLCVSNIEDNIGSQRVYTVISGDPNVSGLFYSSDSGASWVNMGVPSDGSKATFPLIASPISAYIVFCTSDSGKHWMITDVVGTGNFTWTQIDLGGANGTAPHTDGRSCAFSADSNVMFDTNDGGIYRLFNPHGLLSLSERIWDEAAGNLRNAEFHSIAYDAVNKTLFGATQDNSIPHQTAPGDIIWGLNEENWGDGFQVGADNKTVPGSSIHYSSQQNFFHSKRITYNSPTSAVAVDPVPFIISGTGGLGYNQVEGAINNNGGLGTVQWNQSWTLNSNDPTRMLIGTNYLYESFDRGNTFVSLGGLSKNKNGSWIPANPVGMVTAYAYGTGSNPDAIYVGAGGNLWLRTAATGLPTQINTYPGGSPVGIVMHPYQWALAFVLDSNGKVWRTTDGGNTVAGWQDFTGNLSSLTTDVRTIEITPIDAHRDVIFVGGYGGVYMCIFPSDSRFAFWQKYGANFPNALVTKIIYNTNQDFLIAGTLGRSAWSLPNLTKSFFSAPTVDIFQIGQGDCYGGWAEQSTIVLGSKINGIQDLVQPIIFNWDLHGTAVVPVTNTPTISVPLPKAGTEVIITLTITDASGYKLFAYMTGYTITQEEASMRHAVCTLIHKFRLIPIPFWEWDPEKFIASAPLSRKDRLELTRRLDRASMSLKNIIGNLKKLE